MTGYHYLLIYVLISPNVCYYFIIKSTLGGASFSHHLRSRHQLLLPRLRECARACVCVCVYQSKGKEEDVQSVQKRISDERGSITSVNNHAKFVILKSDSVTDRSFDLAFATPQSHPNCGALHTKPLPSSKLHVAPIVPLCRSLRRPC